MRVLSQEGYLEDIVALYSIFDRTHYTFQVQIERISYIWWSIIYNQIFELSMFLINY